MVFFRVYDHCYFNFYYGNWKVNHLSLESLFILLTLQVNGCAGKMGQAVAKAAVSVGLDLIPFSFSAPNEGYQIVQIGSTAVQIRDYSEREEILSTVFKEHPDLILVDYTAPSAVNGAY